MSTRQEPERARARTRSSWEQRRASDLGRVVEPRARRARPSGEQPARPRIEAGSGERRAAPGVGGTPDPREASWVVQGSGAFLDWSGDETEAPDEVGGAPEASGSTVGTGRGAAGEGELARAVAALEERLVARVVAAVHDALAWEREALRRRRAHLAEVAAQLEAARRDLERRRERVVEAARSLARRGEAAARAGGSDAGRPRLEPGAAGPPPEARPGRARAPRPDAP